MCVRARFRQSRELPREKLPIRSEVSSSSSSSNAIIIIIIIIIMIVVVVVVMVVVVVVVVVIVILSKREHRYGGFGLGTGWDGGKQGRDVGVWDYHYGFVIRFQLIIVAARAQSRQEKAVDAGPVERRWRPSTRRPSGGFWRAVRRPS